MAITTTVVATIEGKAKEVEMGYVSFSDYRDIDIYNHATIRQEPSDEETTPTDEGARLTYIRGANFQLGKRYRVTVKEIEDDN